MKRTKPNIELLTQKAIKALNFQNSNAEYVEHMEQLKLKPGGLQTFQPASAHKQFEKDQTALRHINNVLSRHINGRRSAQNNTVVMIDSQYDQQSSLPKDGAFIEGSLAS